MDCSFLNEIEGLQFMPVKADKRPIYENWQNNRIKYNLANCEAVGLVCGVISGNVMALDIDLKYDLTGNLYKNYKSAVNKIDKTILPQLVVQKTVSNGYHFIFRCEAIEGNQKLAQRPTAESERKNTYEKSLAYETSKIDKNIVGEEKEAATAKALTLAAKSRDSDNVRVLLETRGDKGYIACYPTKGYELVHGSFDKIATLSCQQRDILLSVAYSFNEVLKEVYTPSLKVRKNIKGLRPGEDYNERGDVVQLLIDHGWKQVGKKGSKILFQRPGDTKASHSGNFDEAKNWFSVFTTSTEFEAQRPYLPYSVYAILECKGDIPAAIKRLAELGFGDSQQEQKENNLSIPSAIDVSDDDLSFLATEAESDDYLHKWRTGTFEMGKTTGIPELDKHFLFKEGNLVIVNGLDNVGKSTVIWYLSMLSCILHRWKWLIFSSENKVGSIRRKLIEFYWGEPIGSMPEEKYQEAKRFVIQNFDIIKASSRLYNYQDILNMYLKASKTKVYTGLMIDPYNSLKVDIPSKSKASYYDYHYEAASVLQLFGKENNVSIYLNCHVGTVGARNKDKQGYTLAPQKEDTEMGVMFANKADEFLTIHRITQHPTEWMNTEIHVRKVKETETGGKVTSKGCPVILAQTLGVSGFTEEKQVYNPIANFHSKGAKIIDFTMPRSKQFEDEGEQIPF